MGKNSKHKSHKAGKAPSRGKAAPLKPQNTGRRTGSTSPLRSAFQDLTAERYLQSQLQKARRLGDEKDYEEAIAILEPLAAKYPDRPQVWEMLGLACMITSRHERATGAYRRMIKAAALSTGPAQLSRDAALRGRFDLAEAYSWAGQPFLACSLLEDLLPLQPELSRASRGRISTERFEQVRKDCLELIEDFKRQVSPPVDLSEEQYFAWQLALEQAEVALQDEEAARAVEYYAQAIRLNPADREAYRQQAVGLIMDKQPEKAIENYRRLLTMNPLPPTEEAGDLITLIRLMALVGQQREALTYLERLKELAGSAWLEQAQPHAIINLASTLALYGQDQEVYRLIQPLYNDDEWMDQLLAQAEDEEELEAAGWEEEGEQALSAGEELYQEALMLAVVSAAHLGYREEALQWLEEEGDYETSLIRRTWDALANQEEGPLAGGHFFYHNPVEFYSPILAGLEELTSRLADPETQSLEELPEGRAFARRYGTGLMEVYTYMAWIAEDVEDTGMWLAEMLKLEPEVTGAASDGREIRTEEEKDNQPPGPVEPQAPSTTAERSYDSTQPAEQLSEEKAASGVAAVKRLAFGRAGDEKMRLVALATLQREGYLAAGQAYKLWLGGKWHEGTFEELLSTAVADEPPDDTSRSS